MEAGSYLFFYSTNHKNVKSDDEFSIYWKKTNGEVQFYNFWMLGRTHEAIHKDFIDYAVALIKDYFSWPYALLRLLTGAGAH